MSVLLQLQELEVDENEPGFETFQRETDSLQAQAGSYIDHDSTDPLLRKLSGISGSQNKRMPECQELHPLEESSKDVMLLCRCCSCARRHMCSTNRRQMCR